MTAILARYSSYKQTSFKIRQGGDIVEKDPILARGLATAGGWALGPVVAIIILDIFMFIKMIATQGWVHLTLLIVIHIAFAILFRDEFPSLWGGIKNCWNGELPSPNNKSC